MKIENRLHYDIGFGWGMAACQKEMPRVAFGDKRIMDFIKDKCKEPGSSISILKGWIDGYEWQADQNLKQMRC